VQETSYMIPSLSCRSVGMREGLARSLRDSSRGQSLLLPNRHSYSPVHKLQALHRKVCKEIKEGC
jgi:phosphatidate phosphatase PAH1